jgi:hypothetical protein
MHWRSSKESASLRPPVFGTAVPQAWWQSSPVVLHGKLHLPEGKEVWRGFGEERRELLEETPAFNDRQEMRMIRETGTTFETRPKGVYM